MFHKTMYLPPYSPQLNAIELVWRIAKKRFDKNLKQYGRKNYSSKEVFEIVDKVMKEITIEEV